ncbi:MAG: NAD-dependent succinate-semialdehyde dehydrogenase [Synechococcales cyanobacterium]
MSIATQDPCTGEITARFPTWISAQIHERITRAAARFAQSRVVPLAQRCQWLTQTATILRQEKQHWGRQITQEMGKTLKSAVAEVEKSAWVCEYYAAAAPQLLADVPVTEHSRVRYAPLGVVLAVMPWNFPFWQVFRFAAPALVAGNTALLKHASNVPLSALAIEDILLRAGWPEDTFQTLLITGSQVAEVIGDPRVKAASLTGSEPAGISLATHAAQHLKPVVLELGGSDPFIVMPSADLDQAISTAVAARLISNGQSCIAAKRFIIHEAVYPAFVQGMVQQMQRLRVGDPLLPETDVGPLATASIRAELHHQVQRAQAAGATIQTGGELPPGDGYFYPPTVITGLDPTNALAQEEFFGPVALVFAVNSLAQAIALANATPFGLGASAWTRDPDEQQQLLDGIEAGSVVINAMMQSDPRLPFGGIKRSGFGRELGSHGLYELVNIQTLSVY